MRLFLYYALHSFKNQLRKLLKSWVIIFILACALIGGAIGAGAAVLSDVAEEQSSGYSEVLPEEDFDEEAIFGPEEDLIPVEELRDGGTAIFDAVSGLVILGIFIYEVLSAERNGSKIFLPADVNLLFPSPMKPQSVLLFRLMNQILASVAAFIYLLFQLPNLMLNMGMSLWAALTVLVAWVMLLLTGRLIQVMIYTLASTHPGMKAHLRTGVFAVVGVILAGYVVYWRVTGQDYLTAALGYLSAPATRWIPILGWLKGMCVYAMEGSLVGAAACLAALIAAGIVLVWVIWHLKADFYEDAMAKSQETAELMDAVQSRRSSGLVFSRRKKDRSETLRRDGLNRGWGANIYFYKTLYNRFRFARFGFLTKTSGTYLAVALAESLFLRFVVESFSLVPVALTLAAIAFFRSLGNPLEEDTKLDFFRLIPEPAWAKLFWSLLGGGACCLLDMVPALVAAVVILEANPLTALGWLVFALSIDLYATAVGVFLDLSVSAGKNVRQMVQIMFIYFGLLPDAAIMAVGIVMDFVLPAAIGAAALNAALGLLFLALSHRVLEPRGGTPWAVGGVDLRAAKKRFSRLGWGVLTILVVASVAQMIAAALVQNGPDWLLWPATFLPIYLLGVPAGWLVMRGVPAQAPETHTLKPKGIVGTVLICVCLMYAGNLVGTVLTTLLGSLLGQPVENPLNSFALAGDWLPQILFMAVLAPIVEEIVFRKVLIDRMRPYGEKLAVVLSAALFGLFHGNLSQLFYAFALGLAFGYVYVRTGKLRYSIGLHMGVNLFGGVIAPWLLSHLGPDALEQISMGDLEALEGLASPWLAAYGGYVLLMIGLAIAGLVVLIAHSRSITFRRAELELPRGRRFSTACLNPGMILIFLACLAMIVSSLMA